MARIDNDKVISTLNDLITTCRDGQNGFQEAAENVKSADLKSFFLQVSQERAQFVGELQREVRSLGGDPDKSGSASGALHRAWMDIKGSLTGRDDEAILNECERGEDSAVNAYQDALKENLPANINTIVERQFRSVKSVHDRVKSLRDARSATSGR
ncbi:MAG TPA: PA2169 family four-helix-bundle protein [Blastocatellia bacterium]|nr:PA2169 family four-helix-bundle protein [Blastocatellia bacterium]